MTFATLCFSLVTAEGLPEPLGNRIHLPLPVPQHQRNRLASDSLLTAGTEAEIWNNDLWRGPGVRARHNAHLIDWLHAAKDVHS